MHGDLNNVRNADDGERIHKQKASELLPSELVASLVTQARDGLIKI